MQPPQRDIDGITEPHDHDEILNEDFVIRRVSEEQIVQDTATGRRRISSKAFKASSGPKGSMSVDIEKLIIEAGVDPKTWVTTPKWIGSIRIGVSDIRNNNCKVGYDPILSNPYHGGVWGDLKKRPLQKALRSASTWYVQIDDVDILE